MSDLRDQLQQDYEEGQSGFPETWDFRAEGEGAMIVGEVVRITRDAHHKYGTDDVLHVADEETGEIRAVWTSHTVLHDQIAQAGGVAVGDRIGVCYLGLVEREQDHNYHSFSVRVDHQAEDREPQPAGDGAPQGQPHPSGDDRFPNDDLPPELYE